MNTGSLYFSEPEADSTCDYELDRKVKNRWVKQRCGEPAFTIFVVRRAVGEGAAAHYESITAMHLCKSCVARASIEFISLLVA